jgi:hypothetical protein
MDPRRVSGDLLSDSRPSRLVHTRHGPQRLGVHCKASRHLYPKMECIKFNRGWGGFPLGIQGGTVYVFFFYILTGRWGWMSVARDYVPSGAVRLG